LREDDRLMTIAAYRGGGQAHHEFCLGLFEDRLEGKGRKVVAFVDDDLPVLVEQFAKILPTGKRLHDRDVDLA
jgi:hypothetical protein